MRVRWKFRWLLCKVFRWHYPVESFIPNGEWLGDIGVFAPQCVVCGKTWLAENKETQ